MIVPAKHNNKIPPTTETDMIIGILESELVLSMLNKLKEKRKKKEKIPIILLLSLLVVVTNNVDVVTVSLFSEPVVP